MRAFADYEKTQEFTNYQKLPVGAYEIKIIRAEDTENALCILFDISSGEFADYYHNRFNEDRKNYPSEAKYKGVYRLWYPNGGQYDENSKRRMKTAHKIIKADNGLSVDYSKEWDGAALAGAKVGMIFRENEWSKNGKTGFTAQPFSIISLEDLKDGNFTIPAPKYLNSKAAAETQPGIDCYTVEDDDLPF